jgi:uncharacterized membrane protein YcaP (DUF421 family)
LILNYLIAELSGMNRRFRRFIQGSPTLLIHNGEIITAHMAREHITMDAIHQVLREHGISGVEEVSLAVLEVDGSISVLKYDDVPANVVSHKRMRFLQRHQ